MPGKNHALKDLERRLNSDAALRSHFLKDPVKLLADEGVELAPEMAKTVRKQFTELQVSKSQALARPKSILGG